MIDPLFNPSTAITMHYRENCITLLAYVASIRDNRSVLSHCQDVPCCDQKQNLVEQTGEDEMKIIACVLADASTICKSDKTLGYNVRPGILTSLVLLLICCAFPDESIGSCQAPHFYDGNSGRLYRRPILA